MGDQILHLGLDLAKRGEGLRDVVVQRMGAKQGELTAENFIGRNLDPRRLRANPEEERGATISNVIDKRCSHSGGAGCVCHKIASVA